MDRLLRATLNTWNGLLAAARSEAAFRQELVVLAVAVPLAFLIGTETWKPLTLIAARADRAGGRIAQYRDRKAVGFRHPRA